MVFLALLHHPCVGKSGCETERSPLTVDREVSSR